MSKCTKWVTNAVLSCKNWASQAKQSCNQWADHGSNQCSKWKDDGCKKCSKWKDDGCKKCASWADEGSNHCCTWWPCSWFCKAFYWIAKWVCTGFYWVANWVCQAFYWVSNWVCQAFVWIAKIVCIAFTYIVISICVTWSWLASLVCVAWDSARCMGKGAGRLVSQLPNGQPPPQIDHVFVLMLENRAFDHMFGFSGLEGVDTEGNSTKIIGVDPGVDANTDSSTHSAVPATINPPADFALKNVDQDPGHEFEDTLMSLCAQFDDAGNLVQPAPHYQPVLGGYPPITNAGFVENYMHPSNPNDKASSTPDRIMRCFDTPNQLPVLFQLAQEFAICDQWFASMPGPTWPNRFFLLAASTGGLDNSPSSAEVFLATTFEGYRFENGNIFDLLDDNCIDWRIFEGDDFPVSICLNGMNLNATLKGRFTHFDEFQSELSELDFSPQFVFIEPKYGAHDFDITGPGDMSCGNSMHPLDDVTRGEKLIKTVYEAIRNSPHWERSVLLVVFDEHGGFYDHVHPPAAVPPGDTMTDSIIVNHFQYDQLGVRVPGLVISPLVQRGTIDHTLYDHTSMLASVERLFGMKPLTNRDKAANDFLHLLSLETPRADTPTTLNDPATNPNPLDCEEDEDLTQENLIIRRSQLRIARMTGRYNEQPVETLQPSPNQMGFAQAALLRILLTARYPERAQWIEQFRAISNGVDAGLFLTEAQLKLRYGIDFKRYERPDNPDRPVPQQPPAPTSVD